MSEPDYDSLRQAQVVTQPFPHLVVRGFVPEPLLPSIIASLPVLQKGGSFPIESLALGEPARLLIRALESETFRGIVADKFGIDLQAAPTMTTLRGRSRERDGRIHCDSASKLVTVLLYLNTSSAGSEVPPPGALRLLRGANDLSDYAVVVPPVDGTLLVFPNGPDSWHGHPRFVGPRYVVQLNYMTDDAAARGELRRHRLSALVKRLTAA